MALTKRSEWLFIWLSPVPFILTILIPLTFNLIFDFSPAARAPSVLFTKIGMAWSVLSIIAGLYLTLRERNVARGADRLMLAFTTVLAGFPAALFLVTFSLSWMLYFIYK